MNRYVMCSTCVVAYLCTVSVFVQYVYSRYSYSQVEILAVFSTILTSMIAGEAAQQRGIEHDMIKESVCLIKQMKTRRKAFDIQHG